MKSTLYKVYSNGKMTISLPEIESTSEYQYFYATDNDAISISEDGTMIKLKRLKGFYTYRNNKFIKVDYLKNKIRKLKKLIKNEY